MSVSLSSIKDILALIKCIISSIRDTHPSRSIIDAYQSLIVTVYQIQAHPAVQFFKPSCVSNPIYDGSVSSIHDKSYTLSIDMTLL